MTAGKKRNWSGVGWEGLLLALPVLALVVFGFLALRWERRAEREELRARCTALVEALRGDLLDRLRQVSVVGDLRSDEFSGRLPVPGEAGEPLERFLEGDYGAVLGGASAQSEAGLPLRPLAALRLMRSEEDPERLEELAAVVASEPSLVTPRLLAEAEQRYHGLGLELPPVLEGWERRLKLRESFYEFVEVHGSELMARIQSPVWMTHGDWRWFVMRSEGGLLAVERSQFQEVAAESLAPAEASLPAGVKVEVFPNNLDGEVLVEDRRGPVIRFVIVDPIALRGASAGRRGLFVSFLLLAGLLAGVGIWLLVRTVARERELSERKGNLVAAVSHEMRTPVASIRLLAENLAEGTMLEGGDRDKHLRRLVEQSERLSTLVENVLSYSKREAGKAEWRCEEIDVPALLAEAAGQFKALAEHQGVKMTTEMKEFAVPPRGDHRALREALVNLIDNALKHSQAGGEVLCGGEPDGYRADRWRLWVEDSGPGVDKEERERVFEAFYRVGPELRRETRGTGLGLALVKQVADLHRGEAVCREALSGGAHFELLLPLDPSNKTENESQD